MSSYQSTNRNSRCSNIQIVFHLSFLAFRMIDCMPQCSCCHYVCQHAHTHNMLLRFTFTHVSTSCACVTTYKLSSIDHTYIYHVTFIDASDTHTQAISHHCVSECVLVKIQLGISLLHDNSSTGVCVWRTRCLLNVTFLYFYRIHPRVCT